MTGMTALCIKQSVHDCSVFRLLYTVTGIMLTS